MKWSFLIAALFVSPISLSHLPAWSGPQSNMEPYLVADLAQDIKRAAAQSVKDKPQLAREPVAGPALGNPSSRAVAPVAKPVVKPTSTTKGESAAKSAAGKKVNPGASRDARLPGETSAACRKRLGETGKANKSLRQKCDPNAGRGVDTGY